MHNINQPTKGDIANYSYLLGLPGASSNQPCPLCWMTREITSNSSCKRGNLVKTLKNYDAFYQKGQPRLLADWETKEELRPINPQLQQLMIASDISRIDNLLIPGILHTKLRNEFYIL